MIVPAPLLYVPATLAVVAYLTEAFTSKPLATLSTYPLVAASVALTGVETLVISEEATSTVPVPFGLNTMFPSVFVDVISLPLIVILSTANEVIPATSVIVSPSSTKSEPIVTPVLANLALATEPVSLSLDTEPSTN